MLGFAIVVLAGTISVLVGILGLVVRTMVALVVRAMGEGWAAGPRPAAGPPAGSRRPEAAPEFVEKVLTGGVWRLAPSAAAH